jgi:anti-sigma B factor antagonist
MTDGAAFERADRDGESILVVRGEVDLATAGGFRHALQALVETGSSPARVDLSAVTFMDSSGINALVTVRRAAEEAGVELVLVAPSTHARTVLELTGLWTHFTVRPDGA